MHFFCVFRLGENLRFFVFLERRKNFLRAGFRGKVAFFSARSAENFGKMQLAFFSTLKKSSFFSKILVVRDPEKNCATPSHEEKAI